ncbi:MAG: glutamine synthetase [Rhodobiaceae bacterium]|nr:glutamine synthetase [Geminicoccaceae bacterium]MCC0014660.1 glutamine synthetase [Rhodobiaceae bacterium]
MADSRLDRFLDDYPLIESADFLLPDLVGIPRGKRVGVPELRSSIGGDAFFTSTLYALDTTGANVDESGLVWEEGDADRPLYLDPQTLRVVPWREGRAQIIGGIREHDGSPFFADPRELVRSLAQKLKAHGARAVTAVELEFFLLDTDLDDQGSPQLAVSPRLGRRPRDPEVFLHERFDEAEDFFDTLDRFCEAQELPIKGALSEFAPGQFEVNLSHVDDVVQACDDALMFKRCVKAAARLTGRRASFMAKPFEGQSGNGLHVHMSLVDDRHRNLFSEVGNGEDRLKWAVWGLQQAMPESVLIFAPNANSYRRLQPMSYAPTAPTWGYNNRTVALRIPAGPDAARRIEHRTAGADANVYLVVAAILAGVLHGLEEKGDPGLPITGNAYDRKRRNIPTSWADALTAFEKARVLPRLMGERFCKLYASCRRAEYQRFETRITPLEYEWYMSSV